MAKTKKKADSKHNENEQTTIPRGKPKSGKVWKSVRTKPHSSMTKVKALKTTWEEKMAKRQESAQFKERIQNIKEEKAREKERLRKIMEENRKRKLENERKSEIVQVIKDTSKIKKMKKKHLRSIEIR